MRRELVGESLGTALLLYVIVGSGIAAQSLSQDAGVQLFAHAIAVGAGLAVIILMFASVSGSHFNPAVTLAFWMSGDIDSGGAVRYMVAQLVGAVAGVGVANFTFGQDVFAISSTTREGAGLVVSELIGTFVLVLVILALVRLGRSGLVPAAVGAWVAAIVFATASTGFANPAVTVSRMLTDTYTGIAPSSVPWFVVAQLAAAAAAVPVARSLYPQTQSEPSHT